MQDLHTVGLFGLAGCESAGTVVYVSLPGELQSCSNAVTAQRWELCLIVPREQCTFSLYLSWKVKGLVKPAGTSPLGRNHNYSRLYRVQTAVLL